MMSLLLGLSVRMKALRANPNFRFYALADGGTYSSGLFAVEYLTISELLPEWGPLPPEVVPIRAIVADEPTGGKPALFSEVRNFTLPGANILGQHSTMYWEPWPGLPGRDALYPELAVELRSTDDFTRHDPVLAAVVHHVGAIAVEPAGSALVVNSASMPRETGIAAGSIASALGTSLQGSSAKVLAAAAKRIDFFVPADTEVGRATIEVTTAGSGLLTVAVVNEDGSPNTREAPARQGSVIRLHGTGHGPLNEAGGAEAEVWIAGRRVEVLAGGPAPEHPGLWRITVRVPSGGEAAGQVPVCMKAHGTLSNAVAVSVAH